LREDGAQVAVGEAAGKEPEHAQRGEQGMGAGIAEPQARDAVPAGVASGWQTWVMAAWPSAGARARGVGVVPGGDRCLAEDQVGVASFSHRCGLPICHEVCS
jgi:hypothetical protein